MRRNRNLACAVVRDHAASGSPLSLSTMQLSGGPRKTVILTDGTPKIPASSNAVTSSQTRAAGPPPPPAGASEAGPATDASAPGSLLVAAPPSAGVLATAAGAAVAGAAVPVVPLPPPQPTMTSMPTSTTPTNPSRITVTSSAAGSPLAPPPSHRLAAAWPTVIVQLRHRSTDLRSLQSDPPQPYRNLGVVASRERDCGSRLPRGPRARVTRGRSIPP